MGKTIVENLTNKRGSCRYRNLHYCPRRCFRRAENRKGKKNIEFANGAVEEKDMGNVFIEVEGIRVPGQKKNDACVLGLVTLESCGLTVDVVNKKLIPLPKIHHY